MFIIPYSKPRISAWHLLVLLYDDCVSLESRGQDGIKYAMILCLLKHLQIK